MKRDTQIFDLIDKECHRQKEGLELIASENFVSEQVMQAMGSCLTNKYAEATLVLSIRIPRSSPRFWISEVE